MKFLVNRDLIAVEFPPRGRNFLFRDKPIFLHFPTHIFTAPKWHSNGEFVIANTINIFFKKDDIYYVPPLPGMGFYGNICLDNRYKNTTGKPTEVMKMAINQFWKNKSLAHSLNWRCGYLTDWEKESLNGICSCTDWDKNSTRWNSKKDSLIDFKSFQEVENFDNILSRS